MSYHGDIRLGDTIDIQFTTRRFSTGAPFTLAGTPAVSAYIGNSVTEITAGITLTVDFDARTGLNNVRVVASGANGYATATNVSLVITAGTVDAVSVVGEVIGSFSIENRSAAAILTTLGTPAGVSLSADVAAVKAQTAAIETDTQDVQGRLPAALVGGRIDASVGAMAANVITAAALAADAANEIADAFLDRDMSTGTDSGSATVRTARQALRFLRNKWSIAGTTLTVTKEDDTATSWTSEVTTDGAANPITASDPASV